MPRKQAEPEPDVQLDRAQVTELCGLSSPKVIDTYRRRGIFPDPDGMIGRSPWWWRSTVMPWIAQRRHRGYSPTTHPKEHTDGSSPPDPGPARRRSSQSRVPNSRAATRAAARSSG